ncbi:MAG: 16S rRNA (cytosine(967)-C(5))-methyltransferase RsmB, partial [Pseudomonadota bacterium]
VEASRDRALVRRLCNGALRNLPALQWRLSQLLKKPLARKARSVHFLLLSAINELLEQREPAAAIIYASVAAARLAGQSQLTGLVNAVLRNHERRRETLDQTQPNTNAIRYGYPDWLIERIQGDWPEHWQDILEQGNWPPPIWLRVNPHRARVEQLLDALHAQGLECHFEPDFEHAIRLERASAISTLPGYAQGWFSVQDAGAQASARLLRLEPGLRVLDACAAPGGKAAHALEMAEVELSALEISAQRSQRIEQNLDRLGLIATIRVADASKTETWWDGRSFDRILIDAPCSATGVIRRHPDIRWLRRPQDIDNTVATQRQLIKAVWPLLKPGGLLVYASCSILHAENRAQARWLLDNHSDAEAEPTKPAYELVDSLDMQPGQQILPGSLGRDGFYYAVFRRLPTGRT